MPRQTTTQKRQRAQVQLQTNTPGLDVVAPMDVQTAPADQGWASLQRALGVAAPLMAANKQARDTQSKEQGAADRKLDRVDNERLKRESSYADGVAEASAVVQVNAALVEAEAYANELPEGTSPSDRIDRMDQFLKGELGPLLNDPLARRVVADHYQNFLEKKGAQFVAVAREEHQRTVEEATSIELTRVLEGDDVDIAGWVNRMAPTYPGGRSALWGTVVEHVAQRIEETNDPSLRALLPDKVVTEDNQTIDSPVRSAKNRARINLAVARAEKYLEERAEPLREWEDGKVLDHFNAMIDRGEPVEYADVAFMVEGGRWQGEYAAGIVERSRNEIARRKKEKGDFDASLLLMQQLGVKSPLDIVTYPGGPETKEQAQKLSDAILQRVAAGYAEANGLDEIPLTGDQLRQHPQLLQKIFETSRDTRQPMTLLKSYFSEIDPDMGDTVIDRLGMYRVAKAAGVTSMYVSEEQESLFELALSAATAYGVNLDDPTVPAEKRKAIGDMLLRISDPAVKQYVRDNREKAHKRVTSGEFDVAGAFFDEKIRNVAGMSVVQAKLRALTDVYLSGGHKVEKAAELARQRFLDTHFGVKVHGQAYLLPADGFDPSEASVAIEAFEKLVTQQGFTLEPRVAMNGRGLAFAVVGADRLDVPDRAPMSLPAMIERVRKSKPEVFIRAAEANREAQRRRRREQKKLIDRAFGRDIHIQPKL